MAQGNPASSLDAAGEGVVMDGLMPATGGTVLETPEDRSVSQAISS
jgi:hypothetical protein